MGWALETTPEMLVTAQYGQLLAPEEARKLAEKLHCPLLVVHGRSDEIAHYTRGEALAQHGGGDFVLRRRRGACTTCTRSRHVQPARARVRGAAAVSVAAATREQTRARYPDEEGFVERDGVRLFYEVYGSGVPTVLLLPTWALIHSRHWKMQIPFFARHGRVVTFDGRGNGRSDRLLGAEAYAIREFAADTLAVHGRDGDGTRCPRRRVVRGALGRRARRGASGARRRRRVHRAGRPAGAAAARAHRLSPLTSGSTSKKGGRSTTCTTGCGTIGTSSSSSSGGASRSRTRRSRSRTPSAGRSRRPLRCSRTTTPASTCRDRRRLQGALPGAFAVRCSSCTATRTRSTRMRAAWRSPRRRAGSSSRSRAPDTFRSADPVVINLLVQEFVERLP